MDSRSATNQQVERIRSENFQTNKIPNMDLKKKVIDLLHKKINDPQIQLPTQNQQDAAIAKEVQRILSYVQKFKINSLSYEQIQKKFMTSLVCPQTLTISYPMQFSGSSEDEVQPVYLDDDELIPILQRDAIMVQNIFVVKIQKQSVQKLLIDIIEQKQMKPGFEPTVKIERIFGNYVLCSIRRSSHQKKITLKFYLKDIASKQFILPLSFARSQEQNVMIQTRASHNFLQNKDFSEITILQQIVILSLSDSTPKKQLFEEIKKKKNLALQVTKIPYKQIGQSINNTNDKTLFYQTMKELINDLQITKNQNHGLIFFKILSLAALNRTIDAENAEMTKYVCQKLINYCIYSEKTNFKQEKQEQIVAVYKAVQVQLIKNSLQELLFTLLQQLQNQNCIVYKQIHNYRIHQFRENVINEICATPQKRFICLLLGIIYFQNVNHQCKVNLAYTLINNVNRKDMSSLAKQNQLLSIYKIKLQQILTNNSCAPAKLQADQFLEYLKLQQILFRVNTLKDIMISNYNYEKMSQFFQKFPKKEHILSQSSLEIVKIVFTNKQFHPILQRTINQELKEKASAFLKNKDFKKQKLLSCFNKQIIIPCINADIVDQSLIEDYLRILKRKDRFEAFRILGNGVSESFLNQIKNQQRYQKMINEVIKSFRKQNFYTFQDESWHMNFQMNSFITEKALQSVMVSLKQLSNFGKDGKINNLLETILQKANQRQAQNLRTILLMQKMQISQQQTIKNLQADKHYLKILIVLRNKNDTKSKRVKETIQQISRKIMNGEYSFNNLKRLKCFQERDIVRFKDLFSQKVYQSMNDSLKILEDKIRHMELIIKFLGTLQKKFQADSKSCTQKSSSIEHDIAEFCQSKAKNVKNRVVYPEYPPLILYLYNMQWFYKGIDFHDMAIENILRQSQIRLKQIMTKMRQFFDDLTENQLFNYQVFNFYEFHRLGQKQLDQLLSNIYQRNAALITKLKDNLKKAKHMINRAEFYGMICKAISKMCNEDQQLVNSQQLNKIVQFQDYYLRIQNKTLNLKLNEYQQAQKHIIKILQRQFKEDIKYQGEVGLVFSQINIPEEIDLTQIREQPLLGFIGLILISSNFDELTKLCALSKHLKDMKQFLQEYFSEKLVIDEKDIQLCKIAVSFFSEEVAKTPRDLKNLVKIYKTLKNKTKDFFQNLKKVILNNQQFHTCKQMMGNIHHAEATSIKQILENSTFEIKISQATHKTNYSFFIIDKKRRGKQISTLQLQKCKDQALVMLAKYQQQQRNIMNQNMDRDGDETNWKQLSKEFLRLYQLVEKIIKIQNQLLSYGYMIFNDLLDKIPIQRGNLNPLNEYYLRKNRIKQQWIQKVETLYSYSQKATMLRGIKLKQFYKVLIDAEKKDTYKFRYIAPASTIQKFKAYKHQQEPMMAIKVLQEFFNNLKKQNEKNLKKASDRDTYYMQLITFSESNYDYSYSIGLLDKDKVDRLQNDSILYCTNETPDQDIQSFVERAARNPDKQYLLMGYERLPVYQQDIIMNKIIYLKDKQNSCRAKICLVSNSKTQKLYRFALGMTVKRNIQKQMQISEGSNKYIKFLESRLIGKNFGKVQVYESSWPGLGKTTRIQDQAIKQGRRIIYFPISGRTSSQKLFNRLNKITKNVQNNQNVAILLQLYETTNNDILNDFLKQLVMWRSFGYRSQYCCFSNQTSIYIQLQQDYQRYNIPFLKLKQTFPQIFKKIQNFSSDNLKIEDRAIDNYVLNHLIALQNNQIDNTKNLVSWQDYLNQLFQAKQARQLYKKYFQREARKLYQNISYYHFNYWRQLFFDSCVAFSTSYQLKKSTLEDLFRGFKQTQKFRISELRSTFFKQLLKNSIQFVCYSNIRDNQSQLSFFIIPYADKSWFSFIYRYTKDIPLVIKLFLVSQDPQFIKNPAKYSKQENMNQLFVDHELCQLEKKNKQNFDLKITEILRQISGNIGYDIKKCPQYTINLDNFMKICLIASRMRANIPLVIQGEAGVGKTALLRHLVTNVFRYDFVAYTINAGVTQERIIEIIQQINKRCQYAIDQNKNRKVCAFFDQFNTLPELGYIKQLIMEKRFMGASNSQQNNLISFAACNPYRLIEGQENQRAFQVLQLPQTINHILWDFGSLGELQMNKYIKNMLIQISDDHSRKYVDTICDIQNRLNNLNFGTVSLRDIQRVRLLYSWFKRNLPQQNSGIPVPQLIHNQYTNINLRAYVMAIVLNYYIRFNSVKKRDDILMIVNQILRRDVFLEMKAYQEKDFCQRLKIGYGGIAINESLRENIYSYFVSIMNRIPAIIIGNPGCSKSLSARIIRDNFSQKDKKQKQNMDEWLKSFSSISEYAFQGSENCLSSSLSALFERVKENNNSKKKNKNVIPLILFDEIGLAEKSPDNPLKVIHQPLEINYNDQNRNMAFVGISNSELDISKMSRFLIIKRPDPTQADLIQTARQISKDFLKKANLSSSFIENELTKLTKTYVRFIDDWRTRVNRNNTDFFGLRDFYNLIKQFSAQLVHKNVQNNDQTKIKQAAAMAVFRNFNGFNKDYKNFLQNYFGQKQISISYNMMDEVIKMLSENSRRYPLILVPNQIVQSMLSGLICSKFQNNNIMIGSFFNQDKSNENYIINSLMNFVNQAASDTVLIANNLNPVVETTLYDLFNKFYMKRAGNNIYRVALNSGFTMPAKVHSNFNCIVIVRASDFNRMESAFMNRFQKYSITSQDLSNNTTQTIFRSIKGFFGTIQKICQDNGMKHYNRKLLFMNCSDICIKSLIWSSLIKNPKYDVDRHINYCIDIIIQLATKDFEYIFSKLIVKNNLIDSAQATRIEQILQSKERILQKQQTAILITTDLSLWKKQSKYKKTIQIQLYKQQSEILKQINQFLEDPEKNELQIDFKRINGGNMCDNLDRRLNLDPEGQNMIDVQYIVEIVKKCRNTKLLQSRVIKNKKIRIVLEYNRTIQNSPLPEISFLNEYNIYSKEGDGTFAAEGQDQNLLNKIDISPFNKEVLQKIQWNFEEDQHILSCREIFIKDCLKKIKQNSSFFSEIVKSMIKILEGNSIDINQQTIIQQLKKPSNISDYCNIQKALAIGYFKTKFDFPIAICVETLNQHNAFINTNYYSLVNVMKHVYNHDNLKTDMNDFIQRQTKNLKKLYKQISNKIFTSLKTNQNYRKKRAKQCYIPKVSLKKPTFFPFSQKICDDIIQSQNLKKLIKQNANQHTQDQKQQIKENIENILKMTFKGESFNTFKMLQKQKQFLFLDFLIKFLEKNGVPIKNALYIYQIMKIFSESYSFETKVTILIGNIDYWCCIFKIMDIIYQNGIFPTKYTNISQDQSILDRKAYFSQWMLNEIKDKLKLSQKCIYLMKGQTQYKQAKFFQIYSSVMQQIYNLLHLKSINKPQASFILFINQFINFWMDYCQKYGQQSLDKLIKNLDKSKKEAYKIQQIFKFLKNKLSQNNKQASNMILHFLGNKLFYFWIDNSMQKQRKEAIEIMINLAQQNYHFAHNVIGCVLFLFKKINYNFTRGFQYNQGMIKACQDKQVKSLENSIGSSQSNMSILIINIFYREMQAQNWVLPNKQSLNRNFESFTKAAKNISNEVGLICDFYIAFIKLYLYRYIFTQFDAGSPILKRIDETLCDRSIKASGDMKFYCIKMMRKTMRTKQIYQQYIQITKYNWCKQFEKDIFKEQSRQIYIPKSPSNIKDSLQNSMINFKESEGADTIHLQSMIGQIDNNYQNRYEALNFASKYLYSLSYTKQYQNKICDSLIAKQQQLKNVLGPIQAQVYKRSGKAQFDRNLRLQKHEQFRENNLIILNTMNWMLAMKNIKTPMSQLFFNNGVIKSSKQIAEKLKNSFLPCGPENPYISIAKSIYAETFNNNIGVYICGNNCDYMYCHMNCGWPSDKMDCPMCKQKIGSAGGHKLARVQQGARRVISDKVVDNWNFWIGTLKKLEQYWPAQRYYIQAEINRMRQKGTVNYYDQSTKSVKTFNMKGYNLDNSHQRTSIFTAKLINLFMQCNIYWLVSLDCIKDTQYQQLFSINNKQQILHRQFTKIQQLIADIRQNIGLQDKVFPWIFGMQQKIYQFLMSFDKKFNQYIAKKDKQSKQLANKLRQKVSTLSSVHKDLYVDLSVKINQGIVLKEFRKIFEAKDMTFGNQFCRQVFEQGIEDLVKKYLYDQKLNFIAEYETRQGKPQFKYQPYLIEAQTQPARFPSYKQFKTVPIQKISSDAIFKKFQLIIRQNYPIINYVLTNIGQFNALNNFSIVINFINKLMRKANQKISRYLCSQITLAEFWPNKEQIRQFLKSWKMLKNYMGPVQVQCKVFGTMNDQLTENDPLINFLLDTTSKENANGKIIGGIFHNFANKHNQILNNLRSSKNKVAKYRNISTFLDNIQINPQKDIKTFQIREEKLNQQIMEFSILSIVYGNSALQHNFDLFQANLLEKMKGMYELDKEIDHYKSIMYVGEAFSLDAPQAYTASIGTLRDQCYEIIPEQLRLTIKQSLQDLRDNKREKFIEFKGLLEILIYVVSQNSYEKIRDKKISQYVDLESQNVIGLNNQLWQQIDNDDLKICQLVPLYELLEQVYAEILQNELSPKYKQKISVQKLSDIQNFLRSLNRQPNEDQPTLQKTYIAVLRLIVRNCLSGTFDRQTKKIFQNIVYKEDFWPNGFDIYTNLFEFTAQTAQIQLTAAYSYHLLDTIRRMI